MLNIVSVRLRMGSFINIAIVLTFYSCYYSVVFIILLEKLGLEDIILAFMS